MEEARCLDLIPSVDEVKNAVWSCDSSKAPGSYGYNMKFIKESWHIIGKEFSGAVIDFFKTSNMQWNFNMTWVTLYPKFDDAQEIKDYHPISMVGCVYKVISKVMSIRLREVMDDLVGES